MNILSNTKIVIHSITFVVLLLLITSCVMVIKNSTFSSDEDHTITTQKEVRVNGIRIRRRPKHRNDTIVGQND